MEVGLPQAFPQVLRRRLFVDFSVSVQFVVTGYRDDAVRRGTGFFCLLRKFCFQAANRGGVGRRNDTDFLHVAGRLINLLSGKVAERNQGESCSYSKNLDVFNEDLFIQVLRVKGCCLSMNV